MLVGEDVEVLLNEVKLVLEVLVEVVLDDFLLMELIEHLILVVEEVVVVTVHLIMVVMEVLELL
jgi:hypothetical protein